MNTKELSTNIKATVGSSYVSQHKSTAFIYTSLIAVENIFVEELLYYFNRLSSAKKYNSVTDIIVAYNKETEKQHVIIAEAGFKSTTTETLGKGGQNIAVELSNGTYKEYLQRAGTWEFTINFKVRSITRAAVAILADELFVGLQNDVYQRLLRRNITISFNKVRMSNNITPRKIAGDTQVYEITFDINNVSVPWVLLTELNGEILKDFSMTPEIEDPVSIPEAPPLPGGQEIITSTGGYGYNYGDDYGE